MSRRIAFVSGARSEFDLLLPVALEMRNLGHRPEWVLGAAHLSPFHGNTGEVALEESVPIGARVPSLLASDSWAGRGLSMTNLVEGLIRYFDALRPDVVVVAGDREEALAGALAGSVLQIPVAHIYGGDRCAATEWDEVLRPVISKLAHLHFTANDDHRERLIRMGERPDRVWSTGGPNLDVLLTTSVPSVEELAARYDVHPDDGYLLFVMHPSPMMEGVEEVENVEDVLLGLLESGLPLLASYPNTDPGNIAFRAGLDRVARESSLLRLHFNLPRGDWVGLYRNAQAITGNSSSIVSESTLLNVPALLIGHRQDLRITAENVLRVPAKRAEVANGVRTVLTPEFQELARRARSIYGDGHAAPRIAGILSEVELDPMLLQKMMTY